jgi:hypothetical protein
MTDEKAFKKFERRLNRAWEELEDQGAVERRGNLVRITPAGIQLLEQACDRADILTSMQFRALYALVEKTAAAAKTVWN